MLIFAFAIAAPVPFTEAHQRDISCVAAIALVANEQKSAGWSDHPNLSIPGKRWAGVVGQRVMDETGQPREVVALAMSEAAKSLAALGENIEARKDRIAECSVTMYGELNALDAANIALPVPIKRQ